MCVKPWDYINIRGYGKASRAFKKIACVLQVSNEYHGEIQTTPVHRSVVGDIMLLLQPRQLLFSGSQIRFRCCCILFGWHMVEHYYITLLKVKTIEVV